MKKKKIAAVTDENETISQHFGRTMENSVLLINEAQVIDRELLEKANHQDFQRDGLEGQHQDDPRGRGFGRQSGEKHKRPFARRSTTAKFSLHEVWAREPTMVYNRWEFSQLLLTSQKLKKRCKQLSMRALRIIWCDCTEIGIYV